MRASQNARTVTIARHSGAMASGADRNGSEPSRRTSDRAVWMVGDSGALSGRCSVRAARMS